MKILNIHGYGAKAENSVFYALKNNGCDSVSLQLDYDKQSPQEILALLTKAYQENHCEACQEAVWADFLGFRLL